MTYRGIKRGAAAVLLAVSVCCLWGCGFSFCGIFPENRKELVFTCREERPETQLEEEKKTEEATKSDIAEIAEDMSEASPGKVNINEAGPEELMTLKGVGETRAKAIIEYREKNGPFRNIEDIMLIPGIKEGVFSKIKEQIAVQ